MELRPELQLTAVLKALRDVILPAIAPDDTVAQEQGKLAIASLEMILKTSPFAFRFERDELGQFIDLARTLQDQCGSMRAVDALEASISHGGDVLERARADPSEIREANYILREAIGRVIQEAFATLDVSVTGPISAAITEHAKGQTLRERAWVLVQGWEADPSAVPPLDVLVGTQKQS